MRLLLAVMCASFLVLSGCASITTGQTQVMTVQTPNCPEASCELTNKEGVYYVSRTPGTVSVNRKCSKMTIRCSKEGHPDHIMQLSSSIKGMTWGNVLFGGFIGAGVDAATGAACEYPAIVPVNMNCRSQTAADSRETSVHQVAEKTARAAEELGCESLGYVGSGAEGSIVYTAICEDKNALLTCDDEKCTVSTYSEG